MSRKQNRNHAAQRSASHGSKDAEIWEKRRRIVTMQHRRAQHTRNQSAIEERRKKEIMHHVESAAK
jgi:hypothetical protein